MDGATQDCSFLLSSYFSTPDFVVYLGCEQTCTLSILLQVRDWISQLSHFESNATRTLSDVFIYPSRKLSKVSLSCSFHSLLAYTLSRQAHQYLLVLGYLPVLHPIFTSYVRIIYVHLDEWHFSTMVTILLCCHTLKENTIIPGPSTQRVWLNKAILTLTWGTGILLTCCRN